MNKESLPWKAMLSLLAFIVLSVLFLCVFDEDFLTYLGFTNGYSIADYGGFRHLYSSVLDFFVLIKEILTNSFNFIKNGWEAFVGFIESTIQFFTNVGSAITGFLQDVFEFFGWVNTEKPVPETPPSSEYSALRCAISDKIAHLNARKGF